MNQLKLIAMFFMLIDHFAVIMIERGVGLYGNWYVIDRVLRGMGRVAFPIFCYTIVEGFQKTRDTKAYLKRLILFALISEIPFDLAFRGSLIDLHYQNVFWTLAFGLGMLMLYENRFMNDALKALGMLACLFVPLLVHTDYSVYGVLVILLLYIFREEPVKACMAGYVILLLQTTAEVWAIFGFLLILLYNGKRGNGNKILYYIFYPAHLLVLLVLKGSVVSILAGIFRFSL